MLFNNISFILHQPQLSENIGACARAIKNFNFKKLVIVKPKPIFPNDKILATSVGAKDLKLVDYKVRILNTGTEAITRVSIESTDSKGKNWFTIGVSANIIDASFKALVDSLDYKLFKDNAPASL